MGFRTVDGYTHSENGWRMCNRDECDLVRLANFKVINTVAIRKGAPLTILGAWMRWYDLNVEDIEFNYSGGNDDWGWSDGNDVANSNHRSGTAVDLNATKYPWGVPARNNMTTTKIAKIREGLRLFEGTVFWGEDWDYDDPMHYQMGLAEGNPQNDAFAKKLLNGHLGIYGKAPVVTAPKPVTLESIDAKLNLIIDQIGPGHKDWKEQASLGKNPDGSPRWLREAVAALVKKID